ncbi:MAG: ABC transporter permease [Anaeromicrobium sp.]|jgi:putative ABC transport system permease protein|uniref:FtsX-like permease family protein n=1 Tax=Anaeromicrobium sp. TaxID=1929132 RepID=UPI0025D31D35|nr:ABC transporter permease [Anaeromicrobium sp.]MCT4593413.1 ABC transporter permease [Anaeromicrobium sp.]
MYFKIAINNVKKSFKDYSIYFITLTLAVCIFYNFNSIHSQRAMENIHKIGFLIKVISYISVFISIIFGGLIIYANNALIKKRKREFGIYATLGMAKVKICKILIYETLMVGTISLIVGLILGILLSQGISILTGELFQLNMTEYTFTLSIYAFSKTLIYFVIMFLIVIIFNTILVSKGKSVDLIKGAKKNESIKVKNPIYSFVIFILSLILLGIAYYMAWKYSLTPKDIKFPLSILWGSLGTLLFFFGLSGFVLIVLKKSKKIYFKGLNIFVIKQFNHKVNTNFISMAIICLMLFLTIGILGSSFSVKHEAEKRLENIMPFDGVIQLDINHNKGGVRDIKEALKIINMNFYESFQYVVLDYYESNMKIYDLLNEYGNENFKKELKDTNWRKLYVVKLSQYNEMRKLSGQGTVNLKENEILFITRNTHEKKALEKLMKSQKKIRIGNMEYVIKDKHMKEEYNDLTAIVPDVAVKNMDKTIAIMHMKSVTEKNKEELEEKIREIKEKFYRSQYESHEELLNKYGFIISAESKSQIYKETITSIGQLLYIGIYLGFVFLIGSAVLLAIQQLTEASDSLNRYKTLKKIGACDHMINKSIFLQILIHFMLPFTLGLMHSVVGLQIINRLRKSVGLLLGVKLIPVVIVILGIMVIYGVYFYATYLAYKNIVKNS